MATPISRPGFWCALFALLLAPTVRAADWQPIDPAELQLASEPKAPGAAAIILYRQVDRDDSADFERNYVRIKVLTAEGRKHADVVLPYSSGRTNISQIEARTIHADGRIVPFNGEVYQKTVAKARGFKSQTKTFTLSDVQVGDIIEYRYRVGLASGYIFDSHWILSHELYTRRAEFSLRRYGEFSLRLSWPVGLPPGTEPPKESRGRFTLSARDIPAFQIEDYMPPETELQYRVDFIYDTDTSPEKVPQVYWDKFARKQFQQVNAFVDRRKAMEDVVAGIVAPGDTAEQKLRKIYARVQSLRNLGFERELTDQERARQGIKTATDAMNVWSNAYGSGRDITWLFLGLAQAAGLDAHALLLPTRDDYFFNPVFMNSRQLNTNAVLVRVDDKDQFFDPGWKFAAYGELPWSETGVQALKLGKDGGSWVGIPVPSATASRVERTAKLSLDENGALSGNLSVVYRGQAALARRLAQRYEDDAARAEYLEDEIRDAVPSGIEVKLQNSPNWIDPEQPLQAEFKLQINGWAQTAGRRSLLPLGLFGGEERRTFEGEQRVHPIYFQYPAQYYDDLSIALPAGWQVESVPDGRSVNQSVAAYRIASQAGKSALNIQRNLRLDLTLVKPTSYNALRSFFQTVRAGDEEQALISKPGATSGARAR